MILLIISPIGHKCAGHYCAAVIKTYLLLSFSDLTLDTKLQLIRSRDFIQYTFQSLPEMKDVRYKGQWLNAKAHGRLAK